MNASSALALIVPIAILSSGGAPARGAQVFVLEQSPLGIPLVMETEEGVTYGRLDVDEIRETIVVSPGLQVTLQKTPAVNATFASESGESEVSATFSAAAARALPTGSATFLRTMELRGTDGAILGTLEIEIELDLLGLGAEPAFVEMRSGRVTRLTGNGVLEGAMLVNRPLLAHPAAPIDWTVPGR